MDHEINIQSEINRFFLILFKRKWMIVGIVVCLIIPIQYYNQTTPNIYEASAKIKHKEKELGIIDRNLMPFQYNMYYLENLIYEITSFTLMREVVTELPDTILYHLTASHKGMKRDELIDASTRSLMKQVTARALPKSDIISVKVQSQNARWAAMIANKIVETIQWRNRNELLGDVNQVRNTVEEQLVYFEEQVQKSEEALRRFKEKNKITYLDEESQQTLERLTQADTNYNQLKSDLDAAEKRLEFVKSKLQKERDDLVPSITTITSPWATQLKEKLVELEVQYTTLRVQNYQDDHPMMQRLKTQIEETKRNLQQETLKIAQGENTIDPLSEIQKNLQEIASLEVNIHTYKAQVQTLAGIINQYNRELQRLPEQELELGRLIREKEVADKIYTSLLEKREEARIEQAEKTGNIYIIDRAQIPNNPILPKRRFNLILGMFLGTLIGVTVSLVLELFNQKIYSTEDIEKHLKIDVIGTIPNTNNNSPIDRIKSFILLKSMTKHLLPTKKKLWRKESQLAEPNFHANLITLLDPKSPASEAFRGLRTTLLSYTRDKKHTKVFLITGPTPDIGKTFIASNLAVSFAQLGLKSLLIDTDLRKPSIHRTTGLNPIPGITDLLQKLGISQEYLEQEETKTGKSINDKSKYYHDYIFSTPLKNLNVLTCGSTASNPAEILASDIMKYLLIKLRSYFDIIIMDSPPMLAVPDALLVAPYTDAILLVARANMNTINEFNMTKRLLDRINKENIVRIVLNDVGKRDNYYSQYYYQPKTKWDVTS
jgi:capsular exopolysaccharide synthesis family protein